MTLIRGMFVAAFAVLTLGSFAVDKAVAPLFAGLGGKAEPTLIVATAAPAAGREVAALHHATATATATITTTATTTPTTVSSMTITPTPTATRTVRHRRLFRRHLRVRKHPTATPTPLPSPTPTATTGLVTLNRYWVGSQQATPGGTFSIGYVIDNGTGHTQRIMLGASIKASRALSWLTGSIADRYHDVVAIVPPGISTHIRYFTVPGRARPGAYDVAWGLRNIATGRRDALVFASSVLRVIR